MIDPTKYLKIKYLKKISFLYSNTGLSYFLTLLKYMCDNEYSAISFPLIYTFYQHS